MILLKLKFQTTFRTCLLALCVALAWSGWAAAQTSTNKPVLLETNPPALLHQVENLRPPLTFRLDELPFLREHAFLGEPLWRYAASIVYLLLAFLFAKLIDLLAGAWLHRQSAQQTTVPQLTLELLRGPVKLVIFVILVSLGLDFFDWPNRARLYISKALILIVAVALTYLTVKVVESMLLVWRQRHGPGADRRFNDQLFSVVRLSLNIFVVIIAVLVTAQNLDINITAAIASLSIGGLAVGLAAQDTLANLFGAIAVFVDKPFQVGDQIKVDIVEGKVEAIGLRSTRVRSAEGYLVAVPNKTIGSAIISNVSRRPGIVTVTNLSLAQDLPTAKLKRVLELLKEIYEHHPLTAQVAVILNQISGGKLNVQITLRAKPVPDSEYQAGMQELNLAVKDRLESEGIAFS